MHPADLERLANEPDRIKRRIACIAALSRDITGIKPIIVGGCALEFYTGGGYATGDIDLLYPDRGALGATLEQFGFVKTGRHWVNTDLDLHIEILSTTIEERAQPRLSQVETHGDTAYLIGIEDLILDRLNGFVHSDSPDDYQWAKELAALYGADIDWAYLEDATQHDATDSALSQLRKEIDHADL